MWYSGALGLGRANGDLISSRLASQHCLKFIAETLAGDTVEEEVDEVVHEDEEIADRLGVLISQVSTKLPVRFSDEQDDAGSDEDQERERDAQTHQCRLPEASVGLRRFLSGSGWRGVHRNGYGQTTIPLGFEETAHNRTIEQEDEDEGDHHDQSKY